MSSNFVVGACIALGILGTWNTWTLYQVNQRLEYLEDVSHAEPTQQLDKLSDKSNAASDHRRSDTNIKIQRKRKYKSANKSDTTDPIAATSIKSFSPDFMVAPCFPDSDSDVYNHIKNNHVTVVGPGLGRDPRTRPHSSEWSAERQCRAPLRKLGRGSVSCLRNGHRRQSGGD